MADNHRIKMPCLAHIVINPLANLPGPIAFEAHPDFEATEPPRLLKAVHVVLIAFSRMIELIGEI